MPGAPMTLEGWFVLHATYAVEWPSWNALTRAEREPIVREATAVLEATAGSADGHSACYAVLGQKADLLLLHWRRDLVELRRAQAALDRTRLRGFLRPTYGYLSVIEIGTYELAERAEATLKRGGLEPGSEGWDAALRAELERMAGRRLRPDMPDRRYLCFYPMSKRRGEAVNWYDLPAGERAALMAGHGEIGRRYVRQVTQVISGSVGLDDWEWAVTLFADDPLVFKKLVYEMRFDPASARYALFGPFYVGLRFAPSGLGDVLGGPS